MARRLQREGGLKATWSSAGPLPQHVKPRIGAKATVRGKRPLPTGFDTDEIEDDEDNEGHEPLRSLQKLGRRCANELKYRAIQRRARP
ncbi:hypothetical protein Hte_002088 [Hypoxylon texense]